MKKFILCALLPLILVLEGCGGISGSFFAQGGGANLFNPGSLWESLEEAAGEAAPPVLQEEPVENPAEEAVSEEEEPQEYPPEEAQPEEQPQESESQPEAEIVQEEPVNQPEESYSAEPDPDAYPAPDFELTDQYGNTHRLSSYKGKVVFLNFWATWCSPCRAEMPDIQKLYEEYQREGKDVVILGVAYPGNFSEESASGVAGFLEENGYTYPVVMDTSAKTATDYYIDAFPTTYMIDKNGNIFGYVSGMLEEAEMREMIESTIRGK